MFGVVIIVALMVHHFHAELLTQRQSFNLEDKEIKDVLGRPTSKIEKQPVPIKESSSGNLFEAARKYVNESSNSVVSALPKSGHDAIKRLSTRVKRQLPLLEGSHVIIGTFQAFVRSLKGELGTLSANTTETDFKSQLQ